jgi:ADP-ribose pyrophosphatase YjhB (NUDIX family)
MQRLHIVLLWCWKTLPVPRRVRWLILWLANTKYLVGVTGIVFDDAGRVLLVRHTYRKRFPWGLPGGWVGGRERLEAALARELAEETGLEITVGEVYAVQSDFPRPQVDVVYLCRHHGGDFVPNPEIAEIKFCAPGDLPERMLPGQKRLLARVFAERREPAG